MQLPRVKHMAMTVSCAMLTLAQPTSSISAPCEYFPIEHTTGDILVLGKKEIPIVIYAALYGVEVGKNAERFESTINIMIPFYDLHTAVKEMILEEAGQLPNDDCDIKAFIDSGVTTSNGSLVLVAVMNAEKWSCAIGKNIIGNGWVRLAVYIKAEVDNGKVKFTTSDDSSSGGGTVIPLIDDIMGNPVENKMRDIERDMREKFSTAIKKFISEGALEVDASEINLPDQLKTNLVEAKFFRSAGGFGRQESDLSGNEGKYINLQLLGKGSREHRASTVCELLRLSKKKQVVNDLDNLLKGLE